VIPKMITVAKMMMHHPKAPAMINGHQFAELVSYHLVIRFGLYLVVINRWLNIE
jgi:hypothetical protein